MTTAARPTWAPAKGGNEQGGTRIFGPSQKYSSRDIASHTTLKPRLPFFFFILLNLVIYYLDIAYHFMYVCFSMPLCVQE